MFLMLTEPWAQDNPAHKLTAVFSGTQVGIFVDGIYMGKTTVENRAGTVGITRTGGYNAYYDDFTVRKPTQAK